VNSCCSRFFSHLYVFRTIGKHVSFGLSGGDLEGQAIMRVWKHPVVYLGAKEPTCIW
jgi:hypothetical protein